MGESCIVGEAMTDFSQQLNAFSYNFFSNIGDVCQVILTTIAMLWFAWALVSVARGQADFDSIAAQTFYFLFASCVFAGWDIVFRCAEIIVSSGMWFASRALSVSGGAANLSTIGEVICYTQDKFWRVISMSTSASFELSIEFISRMVKIIVLIVVYVGLYIKFVSAMCKPLSRIFVVFSLIGPVVVFSSFPQTRATLLNAVKILVGAQYEQIVAGALIGLSFSLVGFALDLMPAVGSQGSAQAATAWLGSMKYWAAVIIGILTWLNFGTATETVYSIVNVVIRTSGNFLSQYTKIFA